MTEKSINKNNCKWVKAQAEELKALLSYDDKIIAFNRTRAISSIETAMEALEEIKRYIESI